MIRQCIGYAQTCAEPQKRQLVDAGELVKCRGCGDECLVPGESEAARESKPKIGRENPTAIAISLKRDMSLTGHCENCGRTIGKLEQSHVHDGHEVCGECKGRLSPRPAMPSTPICRWCLTPGVSITRGLHGGGEVLTFLLLALFLFVPGIIYYIVMEGRPWCPHCGERN